MNCEGREGSSESERRLVVALVCYRDDARSGGTLRVAETLCKGLEGSGVEVHLIFAYGQAGPTSGAGGAVTHFLGATGPTDLGAWLRARALFKLIQPRVIHFVDNVVWLILATLGSGMPRLCHWHGRILLGKTKWRHRVLMRAVFRLVKWHVFISEGARRSYLHLGMVREANAKVVWNGIDVKRFARSLPKEEARAKLGIPSSVCLAGFVGRMVKHKRASDLVRLLRWLPPKWHAALAGDGADQEATKQLARDLGVDERCHFLGSLEDTTVFYSAVDVYVFLTEYEPFGLVFAEAMAAGVPIVGFAGDGEYEECGIRSGETVDLIPRTPGFYGGRPEPEESYRLLADRVRDSVEKPWKVEESLARAESLVRGSLSMERQCAEMKQLYFRIANQEQ